MVSYSCKLQTERLGPILPHLVTAGHRIAVVGMKSQGGATSASTYFCDRHGRRIRKDWNLKLEYGAFPRD